MIDKVLYYVQTVDMPADIFEHEGKMVPVGAYTALLLIDSETNHICDAALLGREDKWDGLLITENVLNIPTPAYPEIIAALKSLTTPKEVVVGPNGWHILVEEGWEMPKLVVDETPVSEASVYFVEHCAYDGWVDRHRRDKPTVIAVLRRLDTGDVVDINHPADCESWYYLKLVDTADGIAKHGGIYDIQDALEEFNERPGLPLVFMQDGVWRLEMDYDIRKPIINGDYTVEREDEDAND